VDKAVQRVEFLLDRDIHHAGPSGVEPSLEEKTLRQLREQLHGLQKAATELYRKYGGRKRRLALDRVLEAELSSLWEMLEDCRPRAMRGYGPMDEGTAEELDTDILGLIETVLAIRAFLLAAARR
jgi:hypothetical protein